MSVNIANQTTSYADNPMVKPLVNLHSVVTQTFKDLPANGKALEVAKRIAIVAIAPFAYLALSLLAFVGVILNSFFQNKTINNQGPVNRVVQRGPLVDVEDEFEKSKNIILDEINRKFRDCKIVSFKLFLDIVFDGNDFKWEQCFTQSDTAVDIENSSNISANSRIFSDSIDRVLKDARDELDPSEQGKLDIKGKVFVRYKKGNKDQYAYFDFSNDGNFAEQSKPIVSGSDGIDPQKFIDIFFSLTSRPITPQLDSDGNFI